MTRNDQLTLTDLISSAVAQHGGLRVLAATVSVALRRQPRPTDAASLPNFLRKDVGLPQAPLDRINPERLR